MELTPQNKYDYLPKEILIEIFKYLTPKKPQTSKRDLASCLLVCRSWYFAAMSFFEDCIHLAIPDEMFNRLYNDLHNFPILASKISHLKLNKSTTGKEKPETFRSIINLCTNLVELKFANYNDIYHYLRVLNCPETEMLTIQKIQISTMDAASPAVRRFHVWVNYRFRSTITHLELADVDVNGALKNYGGLIKMLEGFPNLTHLKARSVYDGPTTNEFNVSTLLKTCPLLQQIKLYYIGNIVFDNDESTPEKYENITKLKLNTNVIDISTLKHINSHFPNVDKFRLIASRVGHVGAAFTSAESAKIISDFKAYARSMTRSNVRCTYGGELIDIDIGGSRSKYFGVHFILDDMPEALLQELLMMHEDWFDHEDEDDMHEFYDIEYIDFLEEQSIADMIMEQQMEQEDDYSEDDDHYQDYSDGEAERLAFQAEHDFYEEQKAMAQFADEEIERDELARIAIEEELARFSEEEPDPHYESDDNHSYAEDDMHTNISGCSYQGEGIMYDDDDHAEQVYTQEQLDIDDQELDDYLAEQAYIEEQHEICDQEREIYEQELEDHLAEQAYFEERHEQDLEDAMNHFDEHDVDEEEEMRLHEEQEYLENLHSQQMEDYYDEMDHLNEHDYLDQMNELEYFEQQAFGGQDHEDFHDQFDDFDDFHNHGGFDEDDFHNQNGFDDEWF